MTKIKIIGDTHGKLNKLFPLLDNKTTTILNGDIGFLKQYDELFEFIQKNKLFNVFINMGNHDYYPYLNRTLGNFFKFDKFPLMTIRGAYSIDQKYRILGRDYFKEEELNYEEQNRLLNRIKTYKPEIIVSHDAPGFMYEYLLSHHNTLEGNTPHLLNAVFEVHIPKVWIHGHHHKSFKKEIYGCQFICLNELEVLELDI